MFNAYAHSLNKDYDNEIESESTKSKQKTYNYAVKISKLKRKCTMFKGEVEKCE